MNIEIDITRECNFACPSCNRMCNIMPKNPGSVMDMDDIVQVFKQLKQHDVYNVAIMGGEPTLNPHVFSICAYACKNAKHVELVSNGSNPSKIRLLKSIPNLHFKFNDGKVGARESKIKKHINIYDERNFTVKDDYSDCKILTEYGVNVYKHNGIVYFAKCSCISYVSRLLGLEDKYAKTDLNAALSIENADLFKDICQHCALYHKDQKNCLVGKFKDHSIVSPVFQSGLQTIKECYKDTINDNNRSLSGS